MASTTTVTITKVIQNADMRGVHRLRESVRCRPGQAWLFINRAGTQARLVDCQHGVYAHWALKGEVFDMALIAERVAALRLTITLNATIRTARRRWEQAVRIRRVA